MNEWHKLKPRFSMVVKLKFNPFPHTTSLQQTPKKLKKPFKWMHNYWIELKTYWQNQKWLVFSTFGFCHHDFKKLSTAEASEIVYVKERVKLTILPSFQRPKMSKLTLSHMQSHFDASAVDTKFLPRWLLRCQLFITDLLFENILTLINIQIFWHNSSRQLLKTLWPKVKLLMMSNFSLGHNIFNFI